MLEYKDFPPETRRRIHLFFRSSGALVMAYPCGHDDICGYINSPTQTQGKNPKCAGCGSNLDLERVISRTKFYQGRAQYAPYNFKSTA